MDKRHLHHIWTKIRWIKPWYILVLLVIATSVCIYSLRQNNLQMVRLRSAVYTADKNNTDVGTALGALQAFVTTHMNTNLASGPNAPYPPIQLEYTYSRLEAANTQSASNTNQALYTNAENYCQQAIPNGFSGRYRVSCIEEYITSHGVAVQTIPASLYEFSFLSPRWSPDLAGWSLLISIILAIFFVVTVVFRRVIRRYSR
jgi:hypothetical protein